MIDADSATRFYLNFSGFHDLRAMARARSAEAVDEVASQFESLFVQLALKAMRQTSFGDGLLDNDQSRFYQGLLDQQLALSMSASGKGLGLARLIARQLAPQRDGQVDPRLTNEPPLPRALKKTMDRADKLYRSVQELPVDAANTAKAMDTVSRPAGDGATVAPAADGQSLDISAENVSRSREDFLRGLWPLAERAGRELGIAPGVLLAQAALETGWGRSIMRRADGTSGHNLFGIKANGQWQGDRIVAKTWEFREGERVDEAAAFRAYDSFVESFDDYVEFLRANPRYHDALRAASDPRAFLAALQKAGFATDPDYASKVSAILNSRIADFEPDTSERGST